MMRRVHRDPLRLSSSHSHRDTGQVSGRTIELTTSNGTTERCTVRSDVEPDVLRILQRGTPSWRQRHSNPRRRRAPRAPMREVKRRSNHSERHFGARGPLLRGNEVSRPLLAQRPLLHAGLHLHDRERWGHEVSAVFAGESFTGSAGGDRWPSSSQVLEWARKRTKQLAGARAPVTRIIGCRRASQRPHEDVRRRTIPLRKQSVERRRTTRPQASCVGNGAPNELVSAALSGEARTGSSGANGDAPSSGVLADSIRCKKHPK